LSAPYSARGVELSIRGTLSHKPYLDLTADVMEAFGVPLRNEDYRRFAVQPGRYTGRRCAIEPDVSTASYFLAAAAITGGRVTVRGMTLKSRQGDIEFARLLQEMGCIVEDSPAGLTVSGAGTLRGLDVDMNACSDVSLTLAALAPFCETPTHIRNIAHARLQETDRIHAIVTELRRAGVTAEERQDGFSIFPSTPHAATFETYDDHRIAMSLSLIGLRIPGCAILNPECVAKTVPNYFELLDEVTGVKRTSASRQTAAG
ncbi:MAG: 3-phosphoshikimate 1-carboxyvinyltransferase, partial [Chloroflexi bacterium]|nr:3-phosphoshikimate 1-carboxyvinyltransferase [Chloroflexota bacterium]